MPGWVIDDTLQLASRLPCIAACLDVLHCPVNLNARLR